MVIQTGIKLKSMVMSSIVPSLKEISSLASKRKPALEAHLAIQLGKVLSLEYQSCKITLA